MHFAPWDFFPAGFFSYVDKNMRSLLNIFFRCDIITDDKFDVRGDKNEIVFQKH